MNEEVLREIGGRLKEFRLSLGFNTQEDMARALNVTRQTVSKWELGKSMPGGDEWLALGALGMSLDYVVLNIRTVPVTSYARGSYRPPREVAEPTLS